MAEMTIAPVATHGFFIDGKWVEEGEIVEVRAPYDGAVVGRVFRGRREHAEAAWSGVREFKWKHSDGSLLKVPLTPDILGAFWSAVAMIEDSRIHVSAGGNMAFVSLPSNHPVEEIDKTLNKLGLTALVLQGAATTRLGLIQRPAILASVKKVLDPTNRFPPYET